MRSMIPLSQLQPGQKGLVREIKGDGLIRRRLLDLGLVPNTVVEVMRRSPLGDPTAYRIRGAVVALRREEAGQVIMKPW